MKTTKIFLIMAIFLAAHTVFAQQAEAPKAKLNHYSLTLGVGWTHYINNMETADQKVANNFVGFSGKFYWEPEYLVSLGLETGYYKLFRVIDQVGDTTVKIDRNVIPLLLLVRMRIIDNFYIGAGMGISFITGKATGNGKEIVTKTKSLSNFELSGSYLYPLGKVFRVGGEAKVFHFANLNDWMYSVQALVAVRF